MRQHGHTSHIVRYSVSILGFIRILLLGYLFYEYLVSKTDKAPTKGGTLIEGVTSHVTYVPYASNSLQDRFYQNLLFRSCQSYFTSGSQIYYEPDLCNVISDDNKTYVISIVGTGEWSDNAPVTIDDVLYTYENILQKNIWGLPHGKSYEGISIQKLSTNSLTVTFPRSSKDNMQFFVNPILPKHILEDKDWAWYEKNFATTPITNGCGKLSNSRDSSSLIFDVENCPNTWLKYYQVKNTTLESIQKDPGIIDMYIGNNIIPNYNTGVVMTNDYVGLFFNMQRGKLSIYGRKNVIALINKYIYLPENNVPIIKEHFLFDSYPEGVTDKSTIKNAGANTNGDSRIHLVYYAKDPLYIHMINVIKNIMEQEGLSDYFSFDGYEDSQEYLTVLNSKSYDITLQTLALGVKKDISSLFLVDNPLSNPSLYINPNLASQINDYFQSPLQTQYSIKPIISKLYNTDLPFFIIGKAITYVNIKPSLGIPNGIRRDSATVRYKVLHDAVIIYKPQVRRSDFLNWKKFGSFILSELGL